MKEWTGIEIEQAHQGLEQASATTLGRMIFEFSRLDMKCSTRQVCRNKLHRVGRHAPASGQQEHPVIYSFTKFEVQNDQD